MLCYKTSFWPLLQVCLLSVLQRCCVTKQPSGHCSRYVCCLFFKDVVLQNNLLAIAPGMSVVCSSKMLCYKTTFWSLLQVRLLSVLQRCCVTKQPSGHCSRYVCCLFFKDVVLQNILLAIASCMSVVCSSKMLCHKTTFWSLLQVCLLSVLQRCYHKATFWSLLQVCLLSVLQRCCVTKQLSGHCSRYVCSSRMLCYKTTFWSLLQVCLLSVLQRFCVTKHPSGHCSRYVCSSKMLCYKTTFWSLLQVCLLSVLLRCCVTKQHSGHCSTYVCCLFFKDVVSQSNILVIAPGMSVVCSSKMLCYKTTFWSLLQVCLLSVLQGCCVTKQLSGHCSRYVCCLFFKDVITKQHSGHCSRYVCCLFFKDVVLQNNFLVIAPGMSVVCSSRMLCYKTTFWSLLQVCLLSVLQRCCVTKQLSGHCSRYVCCLFKDVVTEQPSGHCSRYVCCLFFKDVVLQNILMVIAPGTSVVCSSKMLYYKVSFWPLLQVYLLYVLERCCVTKHPSGHCSRYVCCLFFKDVVLQNNLLAIAPGMSAVCSKMLLQNNLLAIAPGTSVVCSSKMLCYKISLWSLLQVRLLSVLQRCCITKHPSGHCSRYICCLFFKDVVSQNNLLVIAPGMSVVCSSKMLCHKATFWSVLQVCLLSVLQRCCVTKLLSGHCSRYVCFLFFKDVVLQNNFLVIAPGMSVVCSSKMLSQSNILVIAPGMSVACSSKMLCYKTTFWSLLQVCLLSVLQGCCVTKQLSGHCSRYVCCLFFKDVVLQNNFLVIAPGMSVVCSSRMLCYKTTFWSLLQVCLLSVLQRCCVTKHPSGHCSRYVCCLFFKDVVSQNNILVIAPGMSVVCSSKMLCHKTSFWSLLQVCLLSVLQRCCVTKQPSGHCSRYVCCLFFKGVVSQSNILVIAPAMSVVCSSKMLSQSNILVIAPGMSVVCSSKMLCYKTTFWSLLQVCLLSVLQRCCVTKQLSGHCSRYVCCLFFKDVVLQNNLLAIALCMSVVCSSKMLCHKTSFWSLLQVCLLSVLQRCCVIERPSGHCSRYVCCLFFKGVVSQNILLVIAPGMSVVCSSKVLCHKATFWSLLQVCLLSVLQRCCVIERPSGHCSRYVCCLFFKGVVSQNILLAIAPGMSVVCSSKMLCYKATFWPLLQVRLLSVLQRCCVTKQPSGHCSRYVCCMLLKDVVLQNILLAIAPGMSVVCSSKMLCYKTTFWPLLQVCLLSVLQRCCVTKQPSGHCSRYVCCLFFKDVVLQNNLLVIAPGASVVCSSKMLCYKTSFWSLLQVRLLSVLQRCCVTKHPSGHCSRYVCCLFFKDVVSQNNLLVIAPGMSVVCSSKMLCYKTTFWPFPQVRLLSVLQRCCVAKQPSGHCSRFFCCLFFKDVVLQNILLAIAPCMSVVCSSKMLCHKTTFWSLLQVCLLSVLQRCYHKATFWSLLQVCLLSVLQRCCVTKQLSGHCSRYVCSSRMLCYKTTFWSLLQVCLLSVLQRFCVIKHPSGHCSRYVCCLFFKDVVLQNNLLVIAPGMSVVCSSKMLCHKATFWSLLQVYMLSVLQRCCVIERPSGHCSRYVCCLFFKDVVSQNNLLVIAPGMSVVCSSKMLCYKTTFWSLLQVCLLSVLQRCYHKATFWSLLQVCLLSVLQRCCVTKQLSGHCSRYVCCLFFKDVVLQNNFLVIAPGMSVVCSSKMLCYKTTFWSLLQVCLLSVLQGCCVTKQLSGHCSRYVCCLFFKDVVSQNILLVIAPGMSVVCSSKMLCHKTTFWSLLQVCLLSVLQRCCVIKHPSGHCSRYVCCLFFKGVVSQNNLLVIAPGMSVVCSSKVLCHKATFWSLLQLCLLSVLLRCYHKATFWSLLQVCLLSVLQRCCVTKQLSGHCSRYVCCLFFMDVVLQNNFLVIAPGMSVVCSSRMLCYKTTFWPLLSVCLLSVLQRCCVTKHPSGHCSRYVCCLFFKGVVS